MLEDNYVGYGLGRVSGQDPRCLQDLKSPKFKSPYEQNRLMVYKLVWVATTCKKAETSLLKTKNLFISRHHHDITNITVAVTSYES